MRRGRLTPRERRVLSVIGAANASGTQWVSGFDVFTDLQSSGRFGRANHGRVFSALRALTHGDYVRVRIEPLPGAGKRATYRLTDRGASASASASASADTRLSA